MSSSKTVALDLPAYRFLRRQVRWSGIPTSFRISIVYCDPHSQRLWYNQKAEVNVFLEFSCFSYNPKDVGNFISGSSAFYNTRRKKLDFGPEVKNNLPTAIPTERGSCGV